MERTSLEDLIELAAAAAAADSAALAGETPPYAARGACVSMSRLAAMAGGAGSFGAPRLSAAETAHVAACGVCAARRGAFALRAASATAIRSPRLWRARFRHALPFAAAAALVLLLGQPRPTPPTAPVPQPVRAVPISVRYAPHSGGAADARVDCFQSTAHEACVMLALFRTWNSACQCLMWELHEWDDGATLAEMATGESVDVPLNVAGSVPVQQLFVVAVSRERRDLPGMPAETDRLLECLNHSAPPLGAGEDSSAYTSAVSSCLPSGVTVVPASFVPR